MAKKHKKPQAAAPSRLVEQSHGRPREERIAHGKALRAQYRRDLHAQWKPSLKRADPIDLLIESSKGRLEHLVPIRYGRMMSSPFAFYRGAAAIMAHDLADTPTTGLRLQACGDCHLLNFGGFATPERKVIFDINDFDETSIAPWEWDVKRLTASFVVAGRANGFKRADCRDVAQAAARSYRERLAEAAELPVLQAWYTAIDMEHVLDDMKDKTMRRFYRNKLAKAMEKSAHEKEFARIASLKGEQPRIKDDPPLVYHPTDLNDARAMGVVDRAYARYLETLAPERRVLLERYRVADAAMKVVGVGSVGTMCGILLLVSGAGDAIFLQFKEARGSVLEPYAGKSPFDHCGERVVVGQRLMQAASDMFLGWSTGDAGRHFYVRQLRDAKIKPVVEVMTPANMLSYAAFCGWALARAHARSGDAVVLSSWLGRSEEFDEAMGGFAEAYADQNERDHRALVAAVREGRVEAAAVDR